MEPKHKIRLKTALKKALRKSRKALNFLWQRGWDSNPRYLAVQLISSQSPSTTRTPLHCSISRTQKIISLLEIKNKLYFTIPRTIFSNLARGIITK